MSTDHSYTIRRVKSLEELREALDVLGAQFSPPIQLEDRRFQQLLRAFKTDRPLMLIVLKDGRIVGGALGFKSTLRVIALETEERGKGLGRRLLETFEIAAMQRGLSGVGLGTGDTAKGFYLRLGYRGKSMMQKEFPLPGRVRELRLKKLEALAGDLDVGRPIHLDDSGKIPALISS